MKNKKGFTLIELLAVIVILAIIALIATPIVLNMINSARKSAAKSSALGYIDAIEYNNGFAMLGSDAGVSGYTKVESGDIANINIKFKGKKPDSGSVTIDPSGKVTEATLCVNGYNVKYKDRDARVVGNCSESGEQQVTYKCKKIGSSTLTPGTTVVCDVDGNGEYDNVDEKFYYVSDYYNTETNEFESNYATLIYAYNTVDGIKDTTTNKKYGTIADGPTELKANLPTTTQWSNISLYKTTRNILDQNGNVVVENFDYSGRAARLLTYQEVVRACNNCNPYAANALNGYEFLFDNLTPVGPYPGYWLETIDTEHYDNAAWLLYGQTKQVSITYMHLYDRHAPRPVIDVNKTDIQ